MIEKVTTISLDLNGMIARLSMDVPEYEGASRDPAT